MTISDEKLQKLKLELLKDTYHYKKSKVDLKELNVKCNNCDNSDPCYCLNEVGYCETCYDSWAGLICMNCGNRDFIFTCGYCGQKINIDYSDCEGGIRCSHCNNITYIPSENQIGNVHVNNYLSR